MMNRGLGSIMGYRGGGMPVARFQAGGEIPTANIRTYVDALVAAGGTAADIKAAMDLYGVSPAQLAQAYPNELSLDEIQAVYNATEASPVEKVATFERNYAEQNPVTASSSPVTASSSPPSRADVIRDYVDALYKIPDITSEEAALNLVSKMDEVGVSPDEFAAAIATDATKFTPEQRDVFGNLNLVQTVYNQYNPTGRYSTLSRDTGTGTGTRTDTGAGTDVGGGGDTGADTGADTGTDTGAGADVGGVGGAGNIDTSTEGREELTGGAVLPGPDRYSQVPEYTRQQASGFSFAPIQRGLGQLRGPAYMPGLLQGTEGFGGTGLSQDLVREGIIDYGGRVVPEGTPDAEEINRGVIRDYILNEMIPQGLSPAEVAAASPTLSLGATQQYYNQFAPQGVFSTAAPGRTVLPEDFVLQTGAYTTPVTAISPNTGLPYAAPREFLNAGIDDPVGRSPVLRSGGVIKMAEGGEAQESGGDTASNIGTYIDRLIASGGTGEDIKGAMNLYGVTPEQVREAYPQFSLEELIGNYENLQASPAERIRAFEKRYSTEEAVRQAGSKFDVADYLDEQGRLVSGYSKPMYDKFNRFIGYEYKPYESNVVFGEELRRKEAAMRPTDEEREQMMVEMAMRQGRTGISPITGGLAGIEIGDPMMRRRPQYYSTVEQFRPRYAEGGLANVAQNLAERGRKGDSMLVHMAPEEVAGLRALARAQGTDLTINPRTGLPEAFSLRKLFKAASFILPFVPIPGLFGMSSLLTRSILSGVAAGASAKGGFDFKQALGGGLKAYALGSLGEKMSGATTPGGTPTTPQVTTPEAATVDVMGPSVESGLTPYADISKMPISSTEITAPIPQGSTFTGSVNLPSGPITPTTPVGDMLSSTPTAPVASSSVITPEGQGFGQPITKGFDIAAAGIGGLSLEKAAEETRAGEIQAAAIKKEEEERERRFEELARRTLGRVNVKAGGSINLAKGGMTYMEAGGTTGPTGEPRMVQGTGDGMSDSVPATIEGVQEARLANDEFVIPADVVADIGNGSSNAGAKKLYDMMDHIRKARHGTTKQPPEIRAERLMPA